MFMADDWKTGVNKILDKLRYSDIDEIRPLEIETKNDYISRRNDLLILDESDRKAHKDIDTYLKTESDQPLEDDYSEDDFVHPKSTTERLNSTLIANGFNGDYLKNPNETHTEYLERVQTIQQFGEADELLTKETGKGFVATTKQVYVNSLKSNDLFLDGFEEEQSYTDDDDFKFPDDQKLDFSNKELGIDDTDNGPENEGELDVGGLSGEGELKVGTAGEEIEEETTYPSSLLTDKPSQPYEEGPAPIIPPETDESTTPKSNNPFKTEADRDYTGELNEASNVRTPDKTLTSRIIDGVIENKGYIAGLATAVAATWLFTGTEYGQTTMEKAQETQLVKGIAFSAKGIDPTPHDYTKPDTEVPFNMTIPTDHGNITFHNPYSMIDFLIEEASENRIGIEELEENITTLKDWKSEAREEITELKIDLHKSSVYDAVDMLTNNGILNETEAEHYKNLTRTKYPDEILPLLDTEVDNYYENFEAELSNLNLKLTELQTNAMFSRFYNTDALYETSVSSGVYATHDKISDLREINIEENLGLLSVTMNLTGSEGLENISKIKESNQSFGEFIENLVKDGANQITIQQGVYQKDLENRLLFLIEKRDGDEIDPMRTMHLHSELSAQLIEGLSAKA
jgi:hypothetical protein